MYNLTNVVYGTDFNNIMGDITLIKLLNKNHRYINGINTCEKILCHQKYMTHHYIKNRQLKLCAYAIIKIPSNAYVTINDHSFTTDRAIFDIHSIDELDILYDKEYCEKMVNCNGKMIKYIKCQTYPICYSALISNKLLFKYIIDQSTNTNKSIIGVSSHEYEKLCLDLVMTFDDGLKLIKNQTKNIILSAIEIFPESIIYIDSKLISYELYLDIVNKNGLALQYIPPNYRTNELLMCALMNNCKAIKYIDTITDEMKDYIIINSPSCIKYLNNLSEDQCNKLLDVNPYYAKFINNPPNSIKNRMIAIKPEYAVLFDNATEEELIAAVQKNENIFLRIENPSDNICKAVLDIDPSYIEIISNPSNELILYAISKDPDIINNVNLSDDMMMSIIQHNPYYIESIDFDKQTYPICLHAVQNDGSLINFIDESFYTEELVKCAIKTYPLAAKKLNNISYETFLEILNTEPELFANMKKIQPSYIIKTIVDNPIAITYFKNLSDKILMVLSTVNPIIVDYIEDKNKVNKCNQFINYLI